MLKVWINVSVYQVSTLHEDEGKKILNNIPIRFKKLNLFRINYWCKRELLIIAKDNEKKLIKLVAYVA